MSAFLLALGVIFVAELGDKSQLLAMALAARYRPLPVIVGLSIATAVMHLVSVGIGVVLGASIPTKPVTILAGVAFLGFAAWTWRGDELDEDEEAEIERERRRGRSPVVVASVLFAASELGDKTMLATITLATTEGWFGVWLGSTIGMIAADLLAILVGGKLGDRLSADVVRIGAAVLFALFGVALIVEGVRA